MIDALGPRASVSAHLLAVTARRTMHTVGGGAVAVRSGTCNFDFNEYLLAGVIWMLGWCMVLMGAIVWLPIWAIATFGLGVVFLHNLMDFLPAATGERLSQSALAPLWQILYFGGPIQMGT